MLRFELVSGIGQNPQMPAPTPGTLLGLREYTAARRGGMCSRMVDVAIGNGGKRSREAVHAGAGCARMGDPICALAHRVGQGNQFVVLVGVGGLR